MQRIWIAPDLPSRFICRAEAGPPGALAPSLRLTVVEPDFLVSAGKASERRADRDFLSRSGRRIASRTTACGAGRQSVIRSGS
jgi:hypothetical protein